MRVVWKAGPPPGRGRWWVVWPFEGHVLVEPVCVEPAFIKRDDPDARLLVKLISGVAYPLDSARDEITHHAPLDEPKPPRAR